MGMLVKRWRNSEIPSREGSLPLLLLVNGGQMTTEGIMQIAVIGAGLMGHGIAQEFASAGYHVLMHDVTEEQLQTARTQIEKKSRRACRKCHY